MGVIRRVPRKRICTKYNVCAGALQWKCPHQCADGMDTKRQALYLQSIKSTGDFALCGEGVRRMQEEVNQKTISLCVTGAKMTANLLKAAMRKYLEMEGKHQQKIKTKKQERKQEKKHEPSKEKKTVSGKRGKQTLKQLMDQGGKLTNIEITDHNIKSFDKVARKYSIDYSLKKDKSTEPPRYMVFFKAKDVDVMTKAFQEYAGVSLKKTKKTSILKKLTIAKEKAAKHRERQKSQQKDRDQSR